MDRRHFLKQAGNASIAAAGASLLGGNLLAAPAESASARLEHPGDTLSLAGGWRFHLDPDNMGHEGAWYETQLPKRIHLPGSTDEADYGTKTKGPSSRRA